ncbi:glycosyltransferase [Haloterrigena salinisoli]|uniref:glycosyltransferase n=1 Tax=Haloterrigena salinisoli TaxID=3132747 RepID=UPI0030CBC7AF
MLLEVVVAAFVLTQLCYAAVNCGLLALFLRRPMNVVDERTLGRVLEAHGGQTGREAEQPGRIAARTDGGSPEHERGGPERERDPGPDCRLPSALRRRIHVFVPLVRGRWRGLESTLASIAAQSYPASLVSVTVVYEPGETDVPALEGAIDAERPPGLEVETVALDDAGESAREAGERAWWATGTGTSPTAATMLTAAFESRTVAADDLVAVFEAGSWLPVDTFELAVAGLEEYDVVQTKHTVRDVDAGILPLLESMATAAWSDLGHRSSAGPYHLLGSGYLTEGRVLEDVTAWRRRAGDDVPLGLAASRRGNALGIVDRYVRLDCPPGLEAWLGRKRAWTRDLYRRIFARGWDGVDDLRCWSGTLLLQSLALLTVVGVPAAVFVTLLSASGTSAAPFPLTVRLLVGFNALVWAYYGLRAYRAAWDAVPFRSGPHRIAYSILANPLSQALYAMLWAVPICLGLVDLARGDAATRAPSDR